MQGSYTGISNGCTPAAAGLTAPVAAHVVLVQVPPIGACGATLQKVDLSFNSLTGTLPEFQPGCCDTLNTFSVKVSTPRAATSGAVHMHFSLCA